MESHNVSNAHSFSYNKTEESVDIEGDAAFLRPVRETSCWCSPEVPEK